MLKYFNQNKPLLLLLVSFFIFFFCISFFSETTFDVGDGIRHYLVSRYSWKHPDLFLYSWGKPVYTLLSSPFSQFGLIGANVFNILCGIGSAYFTYKIALKLKLGIPLLVLPFLLFSTAYFPTLNSGLTEPLFGFVLIVCILLMLEKRYLLACSIASFLPFVRTEGNLLLPLFFLVLVYRKQILFTPFLALGTLIYSFVGYFYFGDFLWIINQNPYNGENKSFYGSGELFHFITNYNFIWGAALAILFVFGLLAIFFKGFQSIKNKEVSKSLMPEEVLLIFGAFAIYFIAHSIMWWKGMANSLGLLRVLAGVMPCSAIICLRGFNFAMPPFIQEKKSVFYFLIFVVLFFVIRNPFIQDYFPYKLNFAEKTIRNTGEWYKTSPFVDKKIYSLHPYLVYQLDVDPYNSNKISELWGLYPSIKKAGIAIVPDSSIIFWDSHFGPNECQIPKDSILNDSNFVLIEHFKPEKEFLTFAGDPFEILVFTKNSRFKNRTLDSAFYDFEDTQGLSENANTISDEKSFSGKRSIKLSANDEYSVAFKNVIPVSQEKKIKSITFSAKVLGNTEDIKEALVVVSVDKQTGENLFWAGKQMTFSTENKYKNWEHTQLKFIPVFDFNADVLIKIYIWNKTKKEFYADDITIKFDGVK